MIDNRPVPFWSSLRADVVAHVPLERRGCSRWGWVLRTVGVVVRSSGFHAGAVYRLAHTLRFWLGPLGRGIAGVLFWWNRHVYACSIASTARLGGGLMLPHPQGIVVGPEVVIGPRAWIYQNVTIGGTPGKTGMPRVGADARFYCGAVLAGPITVGDNVVVGANAVVVRDVPERTIVRSPAAEFEPVPDRFLAAGE